MLPLPLELELKILKLMSFMNKISFLEKNLVMPTLVHEYSTSNHRFIICGFVQNKYYATYFMDSGYEIYSREHEFFIDWNGTLYVFDNEFGDPRCLECGMFTCNHNVD